MVLLCSVDFSSAAPVAQSTNYNITNPNYTAQYTPELMTYASKPKLTTNPDLSNSDFLVQ